MTELKENSKEYEYCAGYTRTQEAGGEREKEHYVKRKTGWERRQH